MIECCSHHAVPNVLTVVLEAEHFNFIRNSLLSDNLMLTGCRMPFTIHVKLTEGCDGPDTQLVLNVSPMATIRLLSVVGIP